MGEVRCKPQIRVLPEMAPAALGGERGKSWKQNRPSQSANCSERPYRDPPAPASKRYIITKIQDPTQNNSRGKGTKTHHNEAQRRGGQNSGKGRKKNIPKLGQTGHCRCEGPYRARWTKHAEKKAELHESWHGSAGKGPATMLKGGLSGIRKLGIPPGKETKVPGRGGSQPSHGD